MTDELSVDPVDVSTPNIAWLWDGLLGGKDDLEAGRKGQADLNGPCRGDPVPDRREVVNPRPRLRPALDWPSGRCGRTHGRWAAIQQEEYTVTIYGAVTMTYQDAAEALVGHRPQSPSPVLRGLVPDRCADCGQLWMCVTRARATEVICRKARYVR